MPRDHELNREAERFQLLLNQLRKHLTQLKKVNGELLDENRRLKEKLEKKKEESDVFAGLADSERIALRQQIDGLIAKIDKHLDHE